MQNINLQISSDPVPSSFCPIADRDWSLLVRLLHATIPVSTSVNYGNATPLPDDRGKFWYRLNSDGTPDRVYTWANGLWISPHPMFTGATMIYTGIDSSIAALEVTDGTSASPVTAYAGPFWQKLPNADARFLIQSGTTPAPTSTVLTAGGTGGEELHTLAPAEIGGHFHAVGAINGNDGLTLELMANNAASRPASTSLVVISKIDGANANTTRALSGGLMVTGTNLPDATTVTPFNKMPLYLVVNFITRTARQWFTQQG